MKTFKQIKQMFISRKGQVGISNITDKLIGVVVFVALATALVPIVLANFTNLSNSGIALATLFTTVLGIILAVAIFKGVLKGLQFWLTDVFFLFFLASLLWKMTEKTRNLEDTDISFFFRFYSLIIYNPNGKTSI